MVSNKKYLMFLILFIFIVILILILSKKLKKIISYDDVNFWRIDKDHYLFFDIFARNNEIIIICPAYSDLEIKYDNIEIYLKNKKIKLKKKVDYIEYEPSVIRIYDISSLNLNDNEKLNLQVKYNKKIRTFNILYRLLNKKYRLIASTLFKNDDYLLKTWLNYQKIEGFEHFYMYVNKKMDKKYNFKNVKFIEWNFHYWNNIPKSIPYKNILIHHAQLGQINQFIYKYAKPQSIWHSNFDLDEYFHIPNKIVIDLLDNKYNYLVFDNFFSKLSNNYIPKENELINLKESKILSTKKPSKLHKKFIVKSDDIECSSIHRPKKMNKIIKKINNINGKMIHFYSWSGKNRKISI